MTRSQLGPRRTDERRAGQAPGYTVRGLQKLSKRKVPVRAMGFDVVFNLFLMLLGNPVAILAASTVGYMVTNVLDLIGGRMLRRNTEGIQAPYRAPNAIMVLAIPFAAVNFVLLFLGGPSWGWDAVGLGWAIVLVSIPIYLYRHWSDSRKGGAPSPTEPARVEVAS